MRYLNKNHGDPHGISFYFVYICPFSSLFPSSPVLPASRILVLGWSFDSQILSLVMKLTISFTTLALCASFVLGFPVSRDISSREVKGDVFAREVCMV